MRLEPVWRARDGCAQALFGIPEIIQVGVERRQVVISIKWRFAGGDGAASRQDSLLEGLGAQFRRGASTRDQDQAARIPEIRADAWPAPPFRSEEHTSELQ